jgi:tetratricopeptide (TPR) repeat protein
VHLGEEQKALEVARDFLSQPDFGLDHSGLCESIAFSLMSRGDYQEALPWAKRAGESYSGAGLAALATCYEGMGRSRDASLIYDRLLERYDDSAAYYAFELRHLAGETPAYMRVDTRFEPFNTVFHSTFIGENTSAINQFEGLEGDDPSAAHVLLASIAADELQETEKRNELWRAIVDGKVDYRASSHHEPATKAIVDLFLRSDEERCPTPEEFNRALEVVSDGEKASRAALYYVIGRFYESRGQREQAIAFYIDAAKAPFTTHIYSAAAIYRLRSLGIDPSKIQIEWQGLRKVLKT